MRHERPPGDVQDVYIPIEQVAPAIKENSVEKYQEVCIRYGCVEQINIRCRSNDPDDPMMNGDPHVVCVAVYYGSWDIIEFLRMIGADITVSDKFGRNVAHFAAAGGQIDILIWLVQTLPHNLQWCILAKDLQRRTFLHFAAEYDRVDFFDFATSFARKEEFDYNSQVGAPLHRACMHKASRVIEFLVEMNKEAREANPMLPRSELPIDFNAVGMGRTPLLWLLSSGGVDLVPLCMSAGMSLDCPYMGGWSVLFHLIKLNSFHLAEGLLKMGASVNVVCTNNWTPMHVAAQYRRPEFVRLLYSYGANPHVLSRFKRSPFSFARAYSDKDEDYDTAKAIREINIDYFAKSMLMNVASLPG